MDLFFPLYSYEYAVMQQPLSYSPASRSQQLLVVESTKLHRMSAVFASGISAYLLA
jgi:hypothetical protein